MLTHISEDGSLEAINYFPQLVRCNCLAPSCVVSSEPGLESFSKESNKVRLFWGPVNIKLDKDGLERRWDAPSWISSHWYWESYLMRLEVVYTEALESPRLFRRETLNSTQGKRSSTAWFFRRLNWCRWKLILPRRIWMRTRYGWSR